MRDKFKAASVGEGNTPSDRCGAHWPCAMQPVHIPCVQYGQHASTACTSVCARLPRATGRGNFFPTLKSSGSWHCGHIRTVARSIQKTLLSAGECERNGQCIALIQIARYRQQSRKLVEKASFPLAVCWMAFSLPAHTTEHHWKRTVFAARPPLPAELTR